MIRIAFDLDGVLVDFNTPFLRLCQTIEGKPLGIMDARPTNTELRHLPTSWGWFHEYGFSPDTVTKAWEHTKIPGAEFWRRLPPIEGHDRTSAFLWEFTRQSRLVDVYFITSRPGPMARHQSYEWLKAHGAAPTSTVLVASDKAAIIKALGIELLIDDYHHNAAEVLEQTDAHVALVDALYNQGQLGAHETHPRLRRLVGGLDAIASYLKRLGALPPSFTLPR